MKRSSRVPDISQRMTSSSEYAVRGSIFGGEFIACSQKRGGSTVQGKLCPRSRTSSEQDIRSHSRGTISPEGKAGHRRYLQPRVRKQSTRVSYYRYSQTPRLSPRNGFNGCFVLAPVSGLFCHRRRRDTSRQLDARVAPSQACGEVDGVGTRTGKFSGGLSRMPYIIEPRTGSRRKSGCDELGHPLSADHPWNYGSNASNARRPGQNAPANLNGVSRNGATADIVTHGVNSSRLGPIHNKHHINKTTVRVIESPGTIPQREIDSYPNLGALGAILYLRTNIDLFSKQMVVAICVTNTEAIYCGHCTPREC